SVSNMCILHNSHSQTSEARLCSSEDSCSGGRLPPCIQLINRSLLMQRGEGLVITVADQFSADFGVKVEQTNILDLMRLQNPQLHLATPRISAPKIALLYQLDTIERGRRDGDVDASSEILRGV